MTRNKGNSDARSTYQNQVLDMLSALHGTQLKFIGATETRGNQRNDNIFSRLEMLQNRMDLQFSKTRAGVVFVGTITFLILVSEVLRWIIR